jgi:hypothetical protein
MSYVSKQATALTLAAVTAFGGMAVSATPANAFFGLFNPTQERVQQCLRNDFRRSCCNLWKNPPRQYQNGSIVHESTRDALRRNYSEQRCESQGGGNGGGNPGPGTGGGDNTGTGQGGNNGGNNGGGSDNGGRDGGRTDATPYIVTVPHAFA